jgi:hypothetical protein
MVSEIPFVNSSFKVDASTNMFFTCTTQGYNIDRLNDFSLNVARGTYSSAQFASAITNAFAVKNSTVGNIIFNTTNTVASIDNSNTFNMTIDMTIPFTNSDYEIKIKPESILLKSLETSGNNYAASFPTSGDAGTVLIGNITYTPSNDGYIIDSSYILTIVPKSTSNNKHAGNIDICIPNFQDGEKTGYGGIDIFLENIQNAIVNTTVSINAINEHQKPFGQSTITRSSLNNTTKIYDLSLNIQCYYYLTESSFDISFSDSSSSFTNSRWAELKIDSKYNLHTQRTGAYATIIGNTSIFSSQITINDVSNQIILSTQENSVAPQDTIILSITPNIYSITGLFTEINRLLNTNPKTYGSQISIYTDANNNSYSKILWNINNLYTAADYILNFWDPVSFIACYSNSSSVKSTTWDTTVGWILGFRDYTQYTLISANQRQNSNFKDIYYYLKSSNGAYSYTSKYQGQQLISANIKLTCDTTLSTNLFNYFLISLDDYIQNHLNDGLVTITRSQTAIQVPGYQYTTTQICDPGTGSLITSGASQQDSNNVTNLQLYSLNQSAQSQKSASKIYSPGPFIKDLFGIIPIKAPSNTGDIYTEFGGSLQNQTRMYFGPVNIRKMSIQLLTDRGDLIDLNGSNWTFSFVCEQLYRSSSAST